MRVAGVFAGARRGRERSAGVSGTTLSFFRRRCRRCPSSTTSSSVSRALRREPGATRAAARRAGSACAAQLGRSLSFKTFFTCAARRRRRRRRRRSRYRWLTKQHALLLLLLSFVWRRSTARTRHKVVVVGGRSNARQRRSARAPFSHRLSNFFLSLSDAIGDAIGLVSTTGRGGFSASLIAR